eukprot:295060-Prorocentrum_lima.AAC.1
MAFWYPLTLSGFLSFLSLGREAPWSPWWKSLWGKWSLRLRGTGMIVQSFSPTLRCSWGASCGWP